MTPEELQAARDEHDRVRDQARAQVEAANTAYDKACEVAEYWRAHRHHLPAAPPELASLLDAMTEAMHQ